MTRPTPRPDARFSGRELGTALAILLVAIGAAARATPSLWAVREVGTTYFTFRTLADHPTSPAAYLLLVVYLLVVALVGERLVLARLGEWREVSYPVRWLAGMVPGYVVVSALDRAITLLLPHSLAPGVIAAILVAVAAALMGWPALAGTRRAPGEGGRWTGRLGTVATLLAVAIFLLQRREMHVVGDAFTFFDRLLESARFGIGGSGRLPLIAQHYDELAVLYPMLYGALRLFEGDPLACAWMLYTFFMAGAMCLVYACGRRLGLRSVEALLVTAVLFLGTFSLRPTRDTFLIFDSGNPLAYCLHPGRILGAVLPVLAAAVLLAPGSGRSMGRAAAFALSGVVACGIATTTITNTLVLGALVGFAILTELVGPWTGEAKPASRWAALPAILLVAYPFVAYLDRRTLHYMAPYLLLAIIALLATLLFARLMPLSGLLSAGARRRRVASVWLPRLLGGGAGLALGLFGFGNLLIGRTAGLAGEPQRLWGLRILTRPVETALSTSVVDMFGPYEGAGPLISHLDGPMDFLARFGVVFLLSAGALAVLWRGRPTDGAGEAAAPSSRVGETRLLTLLVFFALAFMTALFVYDFMVGHVRDQLAHWVRSRLLEPWFYGVLFLGLVALRRTFPRRGGTLAFSLVCLWMLKTMLIHPGLAVRQWAVNASYFVREILGWGA